MLIQQVWITAQPVKKIKKMCSSNWKPIRINHGEFKEIAIWPSICLLAGSHLLLLVFRQCRFKIGTLPGFRDRKCAFACCLVLTCTLVNLTAVTGILVNVKFNFACIFGKLSTFFRRFDFFHFVPISYSGKVIQESRTIANLTARCAPYMIRESLATPTTTFPEIFNGLLLWSIYRMKMRTKFEVRSFTRSWYNWGYLKTLGSSWIRPRCLFSILMGFCSDGTWKCNGQIWSP